MWPFHRVLLNGEPLPTSFVSKDELTRSFHQGRLPRPGHTSSCSSVKERPSPNPIAPIWWWALSLNDSYHGQRRGPENGEQDSGIKEWRAGR